MARQNRSMLNQIAVFAAIFLLFQVGFEWLRGSALSGPIFMGIFATTAVVTALYGVFIWVMRRRNNQGD